MSMSFLSKLVCVPFYFRRTAVLMGVPVSGKGLSPAFLFLCPHCLLTPVWMESGQNLFLALML